MTAENSATQPARETVRAANGGNETVPTVRIGGQTLTTHVATVNDNVAFWHSASVTEL